jgi:copper(I)-binding protein
MAMAMAMAGPWAAAMRAANAPPGLEITDAWIRWLPASLPAGGYATLRNTGRTPQVLIGASSPGYGGVSMHQSSLRGDTAVMQPVKEITIPPGATVSFATAGYHLMLEHPTAPVQPGDHVAIALHFAGGSSVNVPFEVRQPLAPHTSTVPDTSAMPGMPGMAGSPP